MRSLVASLLFIFIITTTFGQVRFEKGYLIDKTGKKTECLIKNMDWIDSPVEITYKLSKAEKPAKADFSTISEFGIYDRCKYVAASVRIDRTDRPIPGVKDEMAPIWSRENLFLNVLIEGKAKLYGYTDGKLRRFFYSLSDTMITPLIYKEIHHGSTVVKNTDYRQQLWDKLRIQKSDLETVKRVEYTASSLKSYFRNYNKDFSVNTLEFGAAKKKSYLSLKLTPGLNSASVDLTVVGDQYKKSHLKFAGNQSFRLGLESELLLPFNKYRWGILFEPSYLSYKSDVTVGSETAGIKYSSVELPLGIRYYIYLSDDTRLFLNGFVNPGLAITSGSEIKYSNPEFNYTYKIGAAANVAAGAGLDYKKFSIEARFYGKQDILKNTEFAFADYNRFSVVLGYRFLQAKFK